MDDKTRNHEAWTTKECAKGKAEPAGWRYLHEVSVSDLETSV
jgi:hypothetical protein